MPPPISASDAAAKSTIDAAEVNAYDAASNTFASDAAATMIGDANTVLKISTPTNWRGSILQLKLDHPD